MNPFSAMFSLLVWFATAAASAMQPHHEACPGALYFFSGKPPAWAHDKRVVCRIGNHVFLTDKRNPK